MNSMIGRVDRWSGDIVFTSSELVTSHDLDLVTWRTRPVDRFTCYILTRGARSGILAELILGMRSRASLAPRFCTSVYLKGNPWPLGTEIYVLVLGGSLGSAG